MNLFDEYDVGPEHFTVIAQIESTGRTMAIRNDERFKVDAQFVAQKTSHVIDLDTVIQSCKLDRQVRMLWS